MSNGEPSCHFCGGRAGAAFVARDLNQGMSDQGHAWHRCQACGSLAVHPIPDDPGRYYPDDYHPIPASLDRFLAGVGVQRFKIDLLQRYLAGGRIMEIGPSFCEALWLAKEAGYEVGGIERSGRCVDFARTVLGLQGVVQGDDPATAMAASGACDGVMLWHVYEHLPDPVGFTEAAARALRPGGVILIAQPNPDALQLACLGRRWVHLDTPRHLHLASIGGLDHLMARCGLHRCGVHYDDPGVRGWNRFGWAHSFAPTGARRRPGLPWRAAGRIASLLCSAGESGPSASAYTAVYRKGSP